jgi:O-antigen/teichoic acid export membrane protein
MSSNKALKNIFYSLTNVTFVMLLTFVYRTVFVYMLGVEYLGLSSFIANIFLILSLAEMGLSQAIAYSLYKPLVDKDYHKIACLLALYKKVYVYVGSLVLVLGIIFGFFIESFVGIETELEYVYAIYLLMLLATTVQYFFTYKRVLIIADQKNYEIVGLLNIFTVIDLTCRACAIYLLPTVTGLLLALIIQLFAKLLECYFVNNYVTLKYSKVFDLNSFNKLSAEDSYKIRKNIKALFLHKIGDCVVNGTDNIIIGKFISLAVLGIYSNYVLLVNSAVTLLVTVFNSLTASFGNFFSTNTKESSRLVIGALNLAGFFFFGCLTLFIFHYSNAVIQLWFNEEMLLSNTEVSLIAANFFFLGLRVPLNVIKSGFGIYAQDKYAPLVQGGVNLAFSLLLVLEYGLVGVLLGTLISSILVPFWHRPYIVYKEVFNEIPWSYFSSLLKFLLFTALMSSVFVYSNDLFLVKLSLVSLMLSLFFSLFLYVTIFYLIYKNDEYFRYILQILIKKMRIIFNG